MTAWHIFPATHSILLKPKGGIRRRQSNYRISDAPKEMFLQLRDNSAANSDPPLSLLLSDSEIHELRDSRLAAATHFGRAVQDKASNEDFALSAVIKGPSGKEFSFAAVADGVTTRTFWSARAARISCLGAYKAVRECLRDGIDPGIEVMHVEIAARVANLINQALDFDHRTLTKYKVVPSGWDPLVYEKYNHDLSSWYRSTLLFGVVGTQGGVIGISGDGGVRGLIIEEATQRDPIEVRVLFAEPSKDLTSYVGIKVSASDIRLVSLKSQERVATHVILASDGLDLTLQRYAPNEIDENGRRCCSRYRDLPLSTSETAYDFLEALAADPITVADNLSVARLTWPLSKGRARWASWKTEDFSRWDFAANYAPERSGTRQDQPPREADRLVCANDEEGRPKKWGFRHWAVLTFAVAIGGLTVAWATGRLIMTTEKAPTIPASSRSASAPTDTLLKHIDH